MTIGTGIALAIDRASNRTQARILTAYVSRINNHELGAHPIRIEQMPSDCLMFLIASPCWSDE